MNNNYQTKKRFGQNFLTDANIIQKIIAAISPQAGDNLVEVGPGLGALTLPLLASPANLHIVEVDRDLIDHWHTFIANNPATKLQITAQDALQVDYTTLYTNTDQEPIRLVGNLPYNISTPLLFTFLQHAEHIQDMHFMLQREVVDRMAATPGNKQYGRLTVMLASQCRVQPLFVVKPTSFKPAPKVDSAIVRLIPEHDQNQPYRFELGDYAVFSKLVQAAFGQRRKTIRNTLKHLYSSELLDACLNDSNILTTARPETISPSQYGLLAYHIVQHSA